jgi:hypothetical protein
MVKVWDGECCVLNQHLFKVTSDEFPKWFYLYWCKHHLDEFIAISSSHLISKKPQPTEEQAHVVSHPTASM